MGFWRKQPLLRGYISDTDKFLMAFDQKPEATSASRRAEEIKYERIALLRDHAEVQTPHTRIWEDF